MRTRSQARKRRQQQVQQTSVESSNLEKPDNPPIVTMADNRTMAQLLEAPTEGYEDAIVVPEITANNFEIKHGLLNLVQNKQFFGHTKEKVWKEKNNRMARKGNDTSVDKNDSEDSDKVGEQEENVTGTETPINPVPVAMKTPSVATYKIIKQGEKGVYQIVREDGTDIVYINFGAMMKSISRDDLTELYRIVMNRYE
ncbi:hypothetical protein Tco_0659312 [Tanacetum coccineum]